MTGLGLLSSASSADKSCSAKLVTSRSGDLRQADRGEPSSRSGRAFRPMITTATSSRRAG